MPTADNLIGNVPFVVCRLAIAGNVAHVIKDKERGISGGVDHALGGQPLIVIFVRLLNVTNKPVVVNP